MLAGKHLGRCHEQRLRLGVGRRRQRERGHDGLAGAHVAQQHVVGDRRRGQLPQDVRLRPLLLRRQLEGQCGGKRAHPRTVRPMAHGLATGAALTALAHEHELQEQQLLVDQAAPRLGNLLHRMGGMDAR